MATVRFPNVTATCVVPGSIIGAPGKVTAYVSSTANLVVVTDVRGSAGSVSIDSDGNGRRGVFSMPLDAPHLRRAAGAARTCASGLNEPKRTSVRTIGRRLDELAASRT